VNIREEANAKRRKEPTSGSGGSLAQKKKRRLTEKGTTPGKEIQIHDPDAATIKFDMKKGRAPTKGMKRKGEGGRI